MVRYKVACAVMLPLALIAPVAHAFSTTSSLLHSIHRASPSEHLSMSRTRKNIFSGAPKLPYQKRLQAASGSRGAVGRSIRMVAGETASVVESVLHYPETWAFAVTAVLMGIGWGFDKSIETAEHKIDERMMPVVTQAVIELATLGFISLIIQVTSAGSENRFILRAVLVQ